MALSFQESEGCNEIWEFLCEVQKHFVGIGECAGRMNAQAHALTCSRTSGDDDSSPEPGAVMARELGFDESFHTGDGLLSMLDGDLILPKPTLSNIEQIDNAVRDLAQRLPQVRERFAEWFLKTEYLKLLIELFNDAEDLEDLPALHHLCSIMQHIRESLAACLRCDTLTRLQFCSMTTS